MTDPSSSADPRPIFSSDWPWHFIPTRVHGVLDYAMGFLLIVLPFLPGFPKGPGNTMPFLVPIVLGAFAILYSLFTNYELGVVRWLHMIVHLYLDCISGVVLMIAPWLFSFEKRVYLPFVVLGVLEFGAAICTKTKPTTRSIASVDSKA